mmetsp:Transcript_13199/g.23985  ORF Transcript_13199/g.23985 Transcript_13199/m.23985 type:complete len:510 (-) Transcript_13199:207-1736(-)
MSFTKSHINISIASRQEHPTKMGFNEEEELAFNNVVQNQNAGGAPKTEGDDANAFAPPPTPPAPNSKPRETDLDEDSYVYRDFATIPAPSMEGASLHPQSLQAQKLPAKLASILSDHDLTSVIIWLPHGRSWRVLNRDLFAEHALPRYFGHKNYASFVRIVNAWGFRRITRGADRDAYYHELFLRGRPDLHQRMKRLSTCHRKTPVNKEDKCPNFYELAKTSPLPEIVAQRFQTNGGSIIPEIQPRPLLGHGSAARQMPQFSPLRQGHAVPGGPVASLGSLGGPMGNVNDQVLSLLTNDARSMNAVRQSMTNNPQPSLPRLAQLQRDNEDLRRRIMSMESQQSQGGNQRGMNQQHSMVPDQYSTLSANFGGASNVVPGGGGNDILERELGRMQRDFMMQHSNPPMNNSMNHSMNNSMNHSLLSSMGGGGGSGNPRNEFSFMTGFPRDEMLLRAMHFENQMGYRQPPASSTASTLERAVQQNGGPASTPTAGAAQGNLDDRMKAMTGFRF